jgi:hypothetical protein
MRVVVETGRPVLAVLLSALLCAPAAAQSGELKVVVVEGDGAIHNVRRGATSPVQVEVRDERNRPVEGARVMFTLPEMGPGGRFADGSRSREAFTDERGRAGFSSFVPNDREGRFVVVVRATAAGREATTAIPQTSSLFRYSAPRREVTEGARKSGGRGIALVLGVGAALTLGAVLATRGGGGPSTPPVSIGIGGIDVGGPR